jgi:hypothetical protein
VAVSILTNEYVGEFMRIIALLPLTLAACAGAAPNGTAVYLYPGSKVELVHAGACSTQENISSTGIASASLDTSTWAEQHTRTDQHGNEILAVSPCV